jgi:hypothetical protein
MKQIVYDNITYNIPEAGERSFGQLSEYLVKLAEGSSIVELENSGINKVIILNGSGEFDTKDELDFVMEDEIVDLDELSALKINTDTFMIVDENGDFNSLPIEDIATQTEVTSNTNKLDLFDLSGIVDGQVLKWDSVLGKLIPANDLTGGDAGSVEWGSITGTLSSQADLQIALDAKLDSTSFTSHTGDGTIHFLQTDILMDNIQDGITYVKTENNFTDAEKTKLANLSESGTTDTFTEALAFWNI